jgi:hypothetical protein
MKRNAFNTLLSTLKLRNELNKGIFIDWIEYDFTLKQQVKVATFLKDNNYSPINKSRYGQPDTTDRQQYLNIDIILPQDTYTKN